MADFSGGFSEPTASPSGEGRSRAFRIGCIAVPGIIYLLVLSFTGSLGLDMLIIVLGLVAWLVIASIRRRRQGTTEGGNSVSATRSSASATLAAPTTVSPPPGAPERGVRQSPLCHHYYDPDAVAAAGSYSCECGYLVTAAQINEFDSLSTQIATLEQRREALRAEMASSRASVTNSQSTNPTAKVVTKPKPAKPRRALSTQQWLVIGASILIFVAGMIFVSTNIDTIPQWAFQLITVSLAALTAVGSAYLRTISALLASFFTAFSAAMQLAALAIIGDQLFQFTWNTMPDWWWMVSLLVVSAIAGVLAKFTRIFGWRAIALLTATAAALVLDLGVLRDAFPPLAGVVHIAILTITAVALLGYSRWLRGIPTIVEKDKAFKAYAKELTQREDSALRWFATASSALQLAAGVGMFLIEVLPVATDPLEPISLLTLAAVWLAVALTSNRWSGQLTAKGAEIVAFASIARYVVHIGLTVAAVSVATVIPNLGLQVAFALVLIAVLNLSSGYLAAIAPTPNTTVVSVGVAALVWPLWSLTSLVENNLVELLPAYLFGLALAIVASERRYGYSKWEFVTHGTMTVSIPWFTLTYGLKSFDYLGLGHAAITLAALVAVSIPMLLRSYIAKKTKTAVSPMAGWVGFGGATAVLAVQVTPALGWFTPVRLSELVGLIVALMIYAIGALAVNTWNPAGRSRRWSTVSHSYVTQLTIVVALAGASRANEENQELWIAAVLLGLAVLNYSHGWLRKQKTGLQLGFGLALLSIVPIQNLVAQSNFVLLALASIIAVAILGLAHDRALNRAISGPSRIPIVSALSGISVGLVLIVVSQWTLWNSTALNDHLMVQAVLWALALGSSVWLWSRATRGKDATRVLWWLGLIFATFAGLISVLQNVDSIIDTLRVQWLFSFLVIGLTALGHNRSTRTVWLQPVAYLFNLLAAFVAGIITTSALGWGDIPEPYSFWGSVALVGTTLMLGKANAFRKRLLIDAPILGSAMASWLYSLSLANPDGTDVLTRGIIGLTIISVFAYWKSGREIPVVWLAVGYLSGAGAVAYLVRSAVVWTNWDYNGPEIYSVALALSVAVGNLVAVRRLGRRFAETRLILMLAVFTLPSLAHSLFIGVDFTESRVRQMVALAIIAVVSLWRVGRKGPVAWSVPAYLTSAGAMLAAADIVHVNVWPSFVGPEIYSMPLLIAVLVSHRVCLPRLTPKNSWIAWGVPTAVGLLPSAFETARVATQPLAELGTDQIGRAIAVLLLSAVLLVFGVRAGNLANTTVGMVGLALLLVPNTAFHAESLVAGTQVEATALVIGIFVFIALAVLKRHEILRGRSTVFIGIPVAVIMGPSLVRSLSALANPELTSVDWWRFGILLAAGSVLLIVGALREFGGMFFPGLASVLLTSLPYAFVSSSSQEWFLWVVLLFVAAAMVWVALRLENLRKAGRSSANWIKELK